VAFSPSLSCPGINTSLLQLTGVRILVLSGDGNSHAELKIALGRWFRSYKLQATPGALGVEIRLQDYAKDIQHLLSTDDSPDAHVRIELWVRGGDPYRLKVARYAAMLDKSNSEIMLDKDSFSKLTPEGVSSLPVMSLRLERPGDEAIQLDHCTSEGVSTGSWAFAPEEREPGCWLIYPGSDAQLHIRPLLWTIIGNDIMADEGSSNLAVAISITDQSKREAAIDGVISKMSEDYLESSWNEVDQLTKQVGHLPLVFLDIWRRFACSSKGMAALLIRFGTLPWEFLDRFDQELPFAWEAVPYRAWKQAIACLKDQCERSFGEHGSDIFLTYLDSRVSDIGCQAWCLVLLAWNRKCGLHSGGSEACARASVVWEE